MSVLNLAMSANTYTAGNELTFPPVERVTITVANAGIYLQFAVAPDGQQYTRGGAYPYQGEEKFSIPGIYTYSRNDFQGLAIAGVRFRSAVNNTPAVVSITA